MNDMNDLNVRKPVDTDALFWGVLLIGLGTVFLLERLHIGDMHYVIRNYWPVFLIAVGVSKFFKPGRAWSGLCMIAVGSWLLAVTLHLYDLTYSSSWPLLLIILGGGMVLRAVFEGTRPRRDLGSPNTATSAPTSTDNSPDTSTGARHDG